MSFASTSYILGFLPLVTVVFYIIPMRWRRPWLIASSLFFYAEGDLFHLPFLTASIVLNFLLSRMLDSTAQRTRKAIAAIGVSLNILALCAFKYTAFITGSINHFLPTAALPVIHMTFPLGISFFTIQQIMFLMDRYEKLIEHQSLVDYASFATFFPYLTLGPLVHWKEVRPNDTDARSTLIGIGSILFVLGLLKKTLIADRLGGWVDLTFATAGTLTTGQAWLAAFSYSGQLYFDFSGYTDMAIGSAAILGFNIPANFNKPYLAISIIDFWRRWHITLSRFITTYLYTPLVRSFRRITFFKSMFMTLVAMTIAGLWHGPAWTYVVFGLLHGLALVVNHCWRKAKISLPPPVNWLITFVFVNLAFVVFRSESLSKAAQVLERMAGLGPSSTHPISGAKKVLGILAIAAVFVSYEPSLKTLIDWKAKFGGMVGRKHRSWLEAGLGVAVAIVLIVCLYYLPETPKFLYFQF